MRRLLVFTLVFLAACAPAALPATSTAPPPTVTRVPTASPTPRPLAAVHFRGDAQRTGHYASAAPRAFGGVLWDVALDGLGVHGGPVAAGGTLYVPLQNGQFVALDAATGAERWRYAARTEGIVTSPVVDEDFVYIGTEDGFVALSTDSGDQVWLLAMPTRIYSAPLLVDGALYFAREDGELYGVNAADGSIRWHTPTGPRVLWPPAYEAGTVFLPSVNSLFAVDAATGEVGWEAPLGQEWTPLAVLDGVIYAGSGDGAFFAVSAADGTPLWRTPVAGATWWSAPAVGESLVFAGNQNQTIYAFDAATGAERWTFAAEDWAVSDPVLAEGVLYVGVGNHDRTEGPRRLYALDAATGEWLWEFEAESRLLSAPVIDHGVLFLLTTTGRVVALH